MSEVRLSVRARERMYTVDLMFGIWEPGLEFIYARETRLGSAAEQTNQTAHLQSRVQYRHPCPRAS